MAEQAEQTPAGVKIKQVYGTAALDRLRKEQREKLLPQVEKKLVRLVEKLDAITSEISEAKGAIAEIRAGRITDYQIRRPKGETATATSEGAAEESD